MPETSGHRRVMLKCSGEALMGDAAFGIDFPTLNRIAADIVRAVQTGIGMAIVVGGGNLFRGVKTAAAGMDRASADHMGMLATVMNGLALADALRNAGVRANAWSAIPMPTVCRPYVREDALAALDRGEVVICVGGTGNPFFTTDTAAALRAAELGCDLIAKGTQVDGVYTADPKTDPTATRYDRLTFDEALAKDLRVMDTAAFALARENHIPVMVFALDGPGGITGALTEDGRATTIDNG
ncbi:MAG: UMP kinase [Minwuia sp.]|nr:UMP kinase [Minwuia sp.]